MARDVVQLRKYFQPTSYVLTVDAEACHLVIEGRKLPPPSKRITLHQKGLKIAAAKITRQDKHGPIEHEVIRINHLPTFEQVRLHTDGMLYPGPYVIELNFQLSPNKLEAVKNLGDKKPGRDLLPCVDEPEAWANTKVVISE